MSGIMFNEDGDHFVYTRHEEGLQVGINELQEFIDQYAGTQVKEFVMNVNAMLAMFPAKSRENAIDKYRECVERNIVDNTFNYVGISYDIFVRQGLDIYKIWTDRLRENGISPWISIRMNDIHNTDDQENFLVTQFYRDHKHMTRAPHRPHSHYFDNPLDYSFKEVREHYLSLIREVAERYDFDGLELDWMREPFTLGVGKELEGTGILTGLISEVRSILDDAENTRGHKIKISARVPYSPEVALRFGFDIINWARRGIVDVVVPSARWDTTDNDMPIDLWKQILSGTDVMLCAGLEIGVRAKPAARRTYNSIETAAGSATAYLSMGADRIYLYNYFDKERFTPENYNLLLTSIGDIDTVIKLPRRHVVTYHDMAAPGMKNGNLLPFSCNPPDSNGRIDIHDIRVATGYIPRDAKVTLIIGMDSGKELDASDFEVFVNSHPCILTGSNISLNPGPDYCKLFSFRIETKDIFLEASIVEIASKRSPFSVEWVEIMVQI